MEQMQQGGLLLNRGWTRNAPASAAQSLCTARYAGQHLGDPERASGHALANPSGSSVVTVTLYGPAQ